jgi:hypothetical protein
MNFDSNTPRVERTIGKNEGPSFTVQVPQPFTPGEHTLTEGEASALNQIVAENLGNNLREKLATGQVDANGNVTGPHTAESAQALVDSYLASYEIGVRRAGSGSPRVTDPVEREARKIARAKAVEMVKEAGGKPSDYDLDPIIEKLFTANKDSLMKEGKRIVEATRKAREGAGSLDLSGIDLAGAAKPAAEPVAEEANA